MDLGQYEHKPCGLLSGGNKRKVSMAIACCGEPDCLLLDEPSTGMDSMAKRFMWDVIASLKKERAVVLTTHSMEEADAVCSRIGIMVDGRLRCLGTSQQLKSTYGHGYRLAVRTPAGRTAPVADFVQREFGDLARLHEERKGFLAFDIETRGGDASSTGPVFDLGSMFGLVEANKRKLRLRDFSLSQTTLEQIFLHFAKQQLAVHGQDDYENGDESPFVMDVRKSNAFKSANIVFATVGAGLAMSGIYVFCGVLYLLGLCFTWPQAKMAFRMAIVAATPIGRPLSALRPELPAQPASGRWVVLANIIWLPAALFSAGFHILIGSFLIMTVLLAPLGVHHWRMVGLTLAPFGREVRPARSGTFCCGSATDTASPGRTAFSQIL